MTLFLLIRHGSTDWNDHGLAGRKPGVRLNLEGERQAGALAERLAPVPLSMILSSPLERAQQTADPLARRSGLGVGTCEPLNEVDFGEWTGCSFEQLNGVTSWRWFNTFRSGTRIPGGESIAEVQQRIICELEHLHRTHPEAVIALITHAEVIRSAVAYLAGIPLDLSLRIDIDPASVSVVSFVEYGARIICLNHAGDMLNHLRSAS